MRTKLYTAVGSALITCFASPLFAAPAAVSAASVEQTKIETIVHNYLLRKPEILVEALQILQKKQMEQTGEMVKTTQKNAAHFVQALFNQPEDPSIGTGQNGIVVTEFFDYQCPHCIDMAPVFAAIHKTNPNVKIIYKEFPIRGPISELAAKAALAAQKQNKFSAMHDALLMVNKPLTAELIFSLAQNAQINVPQLKQDINSAAVNAQLKANMDLGQNLKLLGTPAFFIAKNNKDILYVPGQMDEAGLQNAIDKLNK